jgi:hypothetical protein
VYTACGCYSCCVSCQVLKGNAEQAAAAASTAAAKAEAEVKEAQQQLADMRRRMPRPHLPTHGSGSGYPDTDAGCCEGRDGGVGDLPTLQQLARTTSSLQVRACSRMNHCVSIAQWSNLADSCSMPAAA